MIASAMGQESPAIPTNIPTPPQPVASTEASTVTPPLPSPAVEPTQGNSSSTAETSSPTQTGNTSDSTSAPIPSSDQSTPMVNQVQTISKDRTYHRRLQHHHRRDPVVIIQPTPVFITPRSETVIFEQYQPLVQAAETGTVEPPSLPVNYTNLGRDWGVALRRGSVSETQFVEFMRNYIVRATALDYRIFYDAFVNAYGPYGADVFGEAFKRAYW